MEKSKYEEHMEKTENATSYSELRKVLTDDELAFFGIRAVTHDEDFTEDDECLAKDILLLLKASRRSARHCLVVLDEVKSTLLTLSFPMR